MLKSYKLSYLKVCKIDCLRKPRFCSPFDMLNIGRKHSKKDDEVRGLTNQVVMDFRSPSCRANKAYSSVCFVTENLVTLTVQSIVPSVIYQIIEKRWHFFVS